MDFKAGKWELQESKSVKLPLNALSKRVLLKPGTAPTGTGTNLFLLQVCFYQEINGIEYAMNNEAFNGMKVIEVVA